ncbi:MAG: hypothetical protein SGI77_21895 [Pirellulaceae bacterium]|nr:hypothetical protein [Pirellulaceae bacterium]
MNSASANFHARQPRSNLTPILIGFAILVVVFLLFQLLGSALRTSGTEFSPISFTCRDFKISLWTGGTVVQPAYLACSTDISKHLTNSTRSNGNERWDLVDYWKLTQGRVNSEASILTQCMTAENAERELVWENWSKDNPKLAKILWPAVQQLAMHRAYFSVPELLRIAVASPPTNELRSEINRISSRAAVDQIARHIAKKEFSDARIALDWARNFGSSPELDRYEAQIQAGFLTLSGLKK